jgi:hypothetical protein
MRAWSEMERGGKGDDGGRRLGQEGGDKGAEMPWLKIL